MLDPTFTCRDCGASFTIKREILDRYPGWKPSQCLPCKNRGKPKPKARKAAKRRAPRSAPREENLPLAQVLAKYTDGPHDGVFTDGACSGNPGPGGWGTVWVQDGEVVDQRRGHEPQTTNNRMELTALIAAYEMLPRDEETTIWSDSNLCVRTINEWAVGWKRKGWKRGKNKPVKNLELVQRAYNLSLARPLARLRWIKAHNGSRWNEYADALATAWMRDEV